MQGVGDEDALVPIVGVDGISQDHEYEWLSLVINCDSPFGGNSPELFLSVHSQQQPPGFRFGFFKPDVGYNFDGGNETRTAWDYQSRVDAGSMSEYLVAPDKTRDAILSALMDGGEQLDIHVYMDGERKFTFPTYGFPVVATGLSECWKPSN